eukprot:24692-Amphidinium_carterae.1
MEIGGGTARGDMATAACDGALCATQHGDNVLSRLPVPRTDPHSPMRGNCAVMSVPMHLSFGETSHPYMCFKDRRTSRQLAGWYTPMALLRRHRRTKRIVNETDPRWLGAEEQTNNTAEVTAIIEALLWLRDESRDTGFVPLTIVTDSEYARGFLLQPWDPRTNTVLVRRMRDEFFRAADHRHICCVHVRSYGREQDAAKQRYVA